MTLPRALRLALGRLCHTDRGTAPCPEENVIGWVVLGETFALGFACRFLERRNGALWLRLGKWGWPS